MPTYRKWGKRWRVELMRDGQRQSATFATKAEAEAWANGETAILSGRATRTLDAALKRYAEEVSPTKRGGRWELLRIKRWRRELRFRHRQLHDIDAGDLSDWREARLADVSGASVRREMALLASIWEAARLDWRWTNKNPLRDVRKPANSKPRKRVISDAEVEALVSAMGYAGGAPEGPSQRVAVAFLFALETAMRAGEIAGIESAAIRGRWVHLEETKNGEPRDVPLSVAARGLLDLCPDGFGVSAAQIDSLFRRARAKASKCMPEVASIHFHDARRTATTKLAKQLNVMELAKVTGHKDLKVLLNTYYSISPDDLAGKLG